MMEWGNAYKNMKEVEAKSRTEVAVIPRVDPLEYGTSSIEKTNPISVIKPKKKSMTSLYLQFFETAPDGKTRRCKLCKQSYSMSTATGNLGRHLSHHHPGYDKQGDTSQVAQGPIVVIKKPQVHVKNANPDLDHLNWLLLKWLIDASLPPSTFEDEALNNSFKFINPFFKIWPKEKLHDVTHEVFRSMRDDVKSSLEQVNSKFSLTLNFWNSYEQIFYMSVACHWIDESWSLHKVLLDVLRVPYLCSGPEIFYALAKVLNIYNIDKRILFCTYDNSPQAMHACHVLKEELDTRKVSFCYIPCAARTLNLIIEDCLRTPKSMNLIVEDCLRTPKSILSKIREFVLELNLYPGIAQEFNQMCATYQEGCWKFPLDTSATWGGDYTMLDIVRKASNSMDTIIRKHEEIFGNRNILLSPAEKSVITILHAYMESFYKLTTNLCTCKVPTIGLVLFFMDHVMEMISSCRDSCRHDWLKSAADDMATRARTFSSQVYNLFTFIAAILDPRIKKELIPDSLNSDKNLEEAKSYFSRDYSINPFASITNGFASQEPEEFSGVSYAEEIARKRRRTITSIATDELSQFLAEPPVPLSTNSLDWWKLNGTRYPRLSVMARDYLAVQGIAIEPEELFSSKGEERWKQQFCLPFSSMQAVMCIKSWLRCGYKFKFRSSEIDFEKLLDSIPSAPGIASREKKQK